jgi:putative ABC transport system ATP-binding protein
MMIELTRVTKTYATAAGAFTALRDVSLQIGKGEMLALVGKSGSGKSTLLNVIGGIDAPTSGTVRVAGKPIARLGETTGFVFQFFQLLPTLTAAENVILPMDFIGRIPPRERRTRALALLDRVGVADQADKLPAALSGGQQQRVAIARALANEPAVVLADEPTGNLDSVTARAVLELFRAMADSGTTVVIATHERELGGIVDRRIEIVDGAVAAS